MRYLLIASYIVVAALAVFAQNNEQRSPAKNTDPDAAEMVTSDADLGYYIGFKIAESYYSKAEDKKQAVRDILNITDIGAFLKASGYPKKFGGAK